MKGPSKNLESNREKDIETDNFDSAWQRRFLKEVTLELSLQP